MSVTYNTTENNSVQYSTTGEKCLDLFARIGAFRNYDPRQVQEEFKAAFDENNKLATQILFWARAARMGAGERATFHHIFCWYTHESHKFVADNAKTLAELGYWKDLLPYFRIDGVVEVFAQAIKDGDRLACKWAPRKGDNARKLRDACDFTNKGYRQWIKKYSETVENNMSDQQWDGITYSSVPGAAMRKYKKAFDKHDGDRFTAWKEDKNSKASVSASYPHDVIKTIANDGDGWEMYAKADADWALAQKQWDNLPNFIKEGENILPLADVSGSMHGTPMLISISLGLYLANRSKGAFHNKFMTFHEDPSIIRLKGDLKEQFDTIAHSEWGGSTDFEKCYMRILEDAKSVQASPEDMPTMLLVLSDMQFDQASGKMHLQNIRKEYREAGYVMPKLVFWNLRASTCAGSPATAHDDGVALVSGFSPVLMKAVLAVEDFNPLDVMKEALSAIELDFTHLPEVYRVGLLDGDPDPNTLVFDGPESVISDNLFNDDTEDEWIEYQDKNFS